MQIERHIFGSYKGYTTLARSPGVSLDDCRLVERHAFGFGQTYEPRYYKKLEKSPGYFTLQFGGNRRGLTRVTEGERDDQGRPTLLYMTLILTRLDWDAELLGDIGALAESRELWKWDQSGTIMPVNSTLQGSDVIPGRHISPALHILSHLERSAAGRRAVVASEEDIPWEVARAVEMLLPRLARNTITTAYRVLSPQFPARFVTLAADAGAGANYRPDLSEPLSTYGQYLKRRGIDRERIPMECILQYGAFGEKDGRPGGNEALLASASQIVTSEKTEVRTRWGAVWLAASLSLVAGTAIGYFLPRKASRIDNAPATSNSSAGVIAAGAAAASGQAKGVP